MLIIDLLSSTWLLIATQQPTHTLDQAVFTSDINPCVSGFYTGFDGRRVSKNRKIMVVFSYFEFEFTECLLSTFFFCLYFLLYIVCFLPSFLFFFSFFLFFSFFFFLMRGRGSGEVSIVFKYRSFCCTSKNVDCTHVVFHYKCFCFLWYSLCCFPLQVFLFYIKIGVTLIVLVLRVSVLHPKHSSLPFSKSSSLVLAMT